MIIIVVWRQRKGLLWLKDDFSWTIQLTPYLLAPCICRRRASVVYSPWRLLPDQTTKPCRLLDLSSKLRDLRVFQLAIPTTADLGEETDELGQLLDHCWRPQYWKWLVGSNWFFLTTVSLLCLLKIPNWNQSQGRGFSLQSVAFSNEAQGRLKRFQEQPRCCRCWP